MDLETRGHGVSARFVRRVRLSALLISTGLAVEAASLPWAHPLALLYITTVGTALVAIGVAFYLWAEATR